MRAEPAAYAEDAVLNGVMANNDAFHDIASFIGVDQFTNGFRKRLWTAIKDRILEGEPADIVTLMEALPDDGDGIHELFTTMAHGSSVKVYADIVRGNWRRREAGQIAQALMKGARSADDEAIDAAIASLLELNSDVSEHEFTGKQAMVMAWEAAQKAYENGGVLPGITTGLEGLDSILGGWHDSDLTIIGARPAMGKEQPNSSRVLMADGEWLTMGDIRVGDMIASVDGRESFVRGVFPQGVKDVYEFTFADKRTARCGIDHLWEVKYRDWEAPRVLTTAKILEMLTKKRYQRRLMVRLISGDFGRQQDFPLDPWFLGFLIGDGCFRQSTPSFSTPDAEIVGRVGAMLPNGYKLMKSGKYDYRISGEKGKANYLKGILESLGMWGKYSHEKWIPKQYMSGTKEQRLELLRGLIDSDGWVESYNCIKYASSSRQLAEDVQSLARSLGAWCSIRTVKTTHLDSYSLTMRANDQCQFAWLKKKADRISKQKHHLSLTIDSVEFVGREECTCIQVSHDTSLYVTDNYVVTHNTALLLGLADSAAQSGFPVGLVSAEQPTIQIGARRMALASQVSATTIRTGNFHEEDWPKLSMGMRNAKDRPMWIYDRSAITLDELVGIARKWKHTHGIKALFIDYAQRITVKGAGRIEEVSQVARGLKNLARDLNIPVIVLAQVKAAVETRDNKRPHAGDLANSDELTREADQILMLYRDEVYNEETQLRGIAEILIEKNRHGPTGFKKFAFIPEIMAFRDLEERFER